VCLEQLGHGGKNAGDSRSAIRKFSASWAKETAPAEAIGVCVEIGGRDTRDNPPGLKPFLRCLKTGLIGSIGPKNRRNERTIKVAQALSILDVHARTAARAK
jgi:hypothetical protein